MAQFIVIYRLFDSKKILRCDLLESKYKPVRIARTQVQELVNNIHMPMTYSILNSTCVQVFSSLYFPSSGNEDSGYIPINV